MESNLAFVGTRASGKTSCAGLLYLTAQERALREPLKVHTIENNLNIRGIAHAISMGEYPPATAVDENFNATLELEFGRWYNKRSVSVSFVDMAGETMRSLMDKFDRDDFSVEDQPDLTDVARYVLSAGGYILVADLPRVMSIEDDGGLPIDVALARFVESMWRYRREVRRAPRFRGLGLVLTKFDMARDYLAMEGFTFRGRENALRFIKRFMPQTYVALKGLIGLENVEIFYSGIETRKDNGRIFVDAKKRPMYSRDQYDRLLTWISQKFRQ